MMVIKPAEENTTELKTAMKNEEFKPIRIDPKNFPDQSELDNSRPPMTINNVQYLLNEHKILVRYDMVKKDIDILIPGLIATMDNQAEVKLSNIVNICKLNRLSVTELKRFLLAIADENHFNPVADWISSKPWDKVDRLKDIYNTLKTNPDDCPIWFKERVMHKWLLSVTAATETLHAFKARGVLTLQGKQGLGKTSWVRSLMPTEISHQYIKVDHHLDPSNKDSVLTAIRHWIVELGELDSSFKKDVARLKGFLTSDADKIRRPYGSADSEYPRRTVFFASVNQSDFLVDTTGNSRWWVIPVVEIDFEHEIDTQQLFAQLATEIEGGATWWLDTEEEEYLESHNKAHQSTSVIRDALLDELDLSLVNKSGSKAMSASQVLKEVLRRDYPTNPQARECGAILRELLGDPKKIQGTMKWRIPLKSYTDKSSDRLSKLVAQHKDDEDGEY
jgi:putative DNA primase/helicase